MAEFEVSLDWPTPRRFPSKPGNFAVVWGSGHAKLRERREPRPLDPANPEQIASPLFFSYAMYVCVFYRPSLYLLASIKPSSLWPSGIVNLKIGVA